MIRTTDTGLTLRRQARILKGMSIVDLFNGGSLWAEEAECRDKNPEWWFDENSESEELAVRICMGCPIRERCLDYAVQYERGIRHRVYGTYGGRTAAQRREDIVSNDDE